MPAGSKIGRVGAGFKLYRVWDLLPLLLALCLAAACGFFTLGGNGKTVTVRVENTVVWQQPLAKNAEHFIKTKYGENTVAVQNGSCFVKSANCKDAICQKSGKINRRGQSIVCLPHRLVVEVL